MKCNIIQTEEGFIGSDEKHSFRQRNLTNNMSNTPRSESIISGIDVTNDERYKSSHQRQTQCEPTSKSQLVLVKRTGPRKTIQDPAQAGSRVINPFDHENYIENISRFDAGSFASEHRASSINFGKSLTSNIGNSLVNSVPQNYQHSSVDARMMSKDLISQNYKVAPGKIIFSSIFYA